MRSSDLEDLAVPKLFDHRVGHAVGRIDGLLVRIPQVMGNELQEQLRIGRPRQRAPGGGEGPGLEVGEVGGEGAQRVGTHPRIGEMLQCGDIGIGQDLGIAIGRRHRQDGRESVELLGAPDLRCRTGQRSLPLRLELSSDGTMLNTE